MFSSKLEVDRHVEQCLKKVKNDTERNLRCLAFAKLYYKVGEYEQARRYISSYLSARTLSAEGHHLLGQILEKLGKREAAFQAYRTSLDLDPKQNSLVLKICELLASDDVNVDVHEAKYYCEKGQSIDSHNPVIYSLKEKLVASESNDPKAVCTLLLKELESRPTDIDLRIRLLRHLLQSNQVKEAYTHAISIETKNMTFFHHNLKWYEIVAEVLIRYKSDGGNLTHEYWMTLVSTLDKLVGLSLQEHGEHVKPSSEYTTTVFNFDQTLLVAAEKLSDYPDRRILQEFLNHYRGQLCYHLLTLIFKQAKKSFFKYKEALYLSLPLLFTAYHLPPAEYTSLWFGDGTPQEQIKKWHREATFRCSQTGHMLLSAVKRSGKSFVLEKTHVHSSGLWREQLFKKLFVTREQHAKVMGSYFVTSPELLQLQIRLPELSDVVEYSEKSQLVHPDSLHLYIWVGLNHHQLSQFKCVTFEGLPYSVKNLSNCSAESLNVLDVEAFLYCAVLCVRSHSETGRRISLDAEKPLMPAAITEQMGTASQTKWLKCAYRMYKNEYGGDLSDVRLTLIKGIEVVRCVGNHGLDVALLIELGRVFAEKSKNAMKQSDIEYNEARAELYWKMALPQLEKLKNNQILPYTTTQRLFEYKSKELSVTEVYTCIEEGKLFVGTQLMKRNEYEKALQVFENLKDPYASFYQAEIYKKNAENDGKEYPTASMQNQRHVLLTKARDCLYLTLDRLREPSVDRRHPLNARLGTEIEAIERMLSKVDPECANRNECDGMSDENESLTDSAGDRFTPNYSARYSGFLNNSLNTVGSPCLVERREARPSPERLDAQLRQLAAAKDSAIGHILDQNKLMVESHRNLVDELRGFKDVVCKLTTTVDELKSITVNDVKGIQQSVAELKTSVDDLQNFRNVTDMVYEMKKEISELRREASKSKNAAQLSEEDLYPLDDEFGADYSIASNIAGATATPAFNPSSLYPNYPAARLPAPGTLAYPPPPLYPGMYPTMAYHYAGLGLPQPGGLPFGAEHQLAAELRAMNTLTQNLGQQQPNYGGHPLLQSALGLGQPPLSLPSSTLLGTPSMPQFFKETDSKTTSDMSVSTTSMFSSMPPISSTIPLSTVKSAPVNVVITSSDPLPTGKATTSQPILSVTIPAQHLKGNVPPKSQPHNYQIPLPAVTVSGVTSGPSVLNQAVLPVTTQGILSAVAPPVYSAISPEKSGSKSAGLGLQIEKSLSQSFNDGNNSKGDLSRSGALGGSFEEHDPCPDFKPIIPLPDQVPVNTGEENEEVLFCERAKLFRYSNKEWKERGVGNIKILKNLDSGKVRVLMRREQVHKICANHFLTADMSLTPMANNDKAYVWAANDFADEQVVLEKLCVRFKTVDEACKFYRAFEEAKLGLPAAGDEVTVGAPVGTKTESVAVAGAPQNLTASLGGFTFMNAPNFKPKAEIVTPTKEVKQEPPKLSPFAGFTFTSSKASTPILFNTTPSDFRAAVIAKQPEIESPKISTPPVSDRESDAAEFVPTAEYKPVVPLPDIVDLKTGEENAEVLFECRAKLLRYDGPTKEWKERGIGTMKILRENNTIRLVMRREQVHKVCCNHQLLKAAKFAKIPGNLKAVSWGAEDYADDVLKTEIFAIRFKNEELADGFLKAVASAQATLTESNTLTPKKEQQKQQQQQQPSGGKMTKVETPPKTPADWGEKFKPKSGSWTCKTCYIINEGKRNYCEACDSPKSDAVPKKEEGQKGAAQTSFSFGVGKPGQGFLFGVQKPAATTANQGFGDTFKTKEGSWTCESCMVSNTPDQLYCVCCESPKDCTVPPKGAQTKGVNLETPGLSFSFGIPKETTVTPVKPTTTGSTTGITGSSFSFGSSGFNFSVKPPDAPKEAPLNLSSNAPFVFKPVELKENAKSPQQAAEDSESRDKFVFGSPQKHAFEFVPRSPRRQSGGHGEGEESDGSYVEEETDNIYFKPVVPLPDKVDVKTGEEHEDVLYCQRAKLFRFVQGEWKERGIGELKVLRRADNGKLRVLMRREQVLKICLNHVLTADVEYRPKDEKTWLFSAPDFSEGEINHQQFCIRFKTPEIATEFKFAVDNALSTNSSRTEATTASERDDSDVVVIFETIVTPEEEQEAKKLGLPAKFFAYRQLPDCTCEQCRKDDEYYNETNASSPPSQKEFGTPVGTASSSSFGSSFFETPTSDISKLPGAVSFIGDTPPVQKTDDDRAKNETLKSLLLKPSIFGQTTAVVSDTKSEPSFFTPPSGSVFGLAPSKSESSGLFKNFSFSLPTTTTPATVSSSSTSSIFSMPSAFGNNAFSFGSNATPTTTTASIFGGGGSAVLFGTAGSKSSLDSSASTPIFGSTKTQLFDVPRTTSSVSFFTDSGKGNSESASKVFGDSSSSVFGVVEKVETKAEPDVVLTADAALSFASLAAKNPAQPAFQTAEGDGSANPFGFLGAGAPVFGMNRKSAQKKLLEKTGSGDEAEADVEGSEDAEEYDPHYEPLVPLPDAIVVSTGEEDEAQVFIERAKLFRFDVDTKEWKERGVGQLKILHHPTNKTYRLLLRREQVHKVVLNQLITADLDLQPLTSSDRAWLWVGYNYTDDESALEKLAVRFKNPELAAQFHQVVQSAIANIKEQAEAAKCIPSTVQSYEDVSTDEAGDDARPVVVVEEPDDDAEEDDDEDDDDEDDERNVMFMKRCTLSEQGPSGEWSEVAMGDVRIYFDQDLYGARISINDDEGCIISNTIIGINTEMRLNKNTCEWRAVEWAHGDKFEWRTLRSTFSSEAAAEEFYISYQEGVNYAQQIDLVDEIPIVQDAD